MITADKLRELEEKIKDINLRLLEIRREAGVTNFLGLSDTPASYSGEGGKFCEVKVTEDGIKFGVAGGGGGNVGAYFGARISGYYYSVPTTGAAMTTEWLNPTVLYGNPFLVPAEQNFDRIAVYVTTAGSAGQKARLGIYNKSSSGPGSLLLDAGEVLIDVTGLREITINQTLSPDLYYLALIAQGGTYRSHYQGEVIPVCGWDNIAADNSPVNYFRYSPQTYGVLPDPFPTPDARSGEVIHIFLRKS